MNWIVQLPAKAQEALRRYSEHQEKIRAQKLDMSVRIWFENCNIISEICGEALFDADSGITDIGLLMDQVDRNLFALRDNASDMSKAVRRYDLELARRADWVTQLVFKLRNQTARFLIRSQGPVPYENEGSGQDEFRSIYYFRALREAGFTARDIKKKLDNEIELICSDLEKLINVVEFSVKTIN